MDRVTVDWRDRRMTGYARVAHEKGLPSYFDAPLISHVEGNLWQGGCMNNTVLDDDFMGVVSLYPWEQYVIGIETKRVEFRMHDSHEGVNWADLNEASDAVVEFLARGKTLVHCQAGLNRSGLVATLAMMKLGSTADDAIAQLRASRSPMVLCNDKFVEQIYAVEKFGWDVLITEF